MDVDAKLLVIEWHRDLDKLKLGMQNAGDSGNAVEYYKLEAEHGRLHRCIDSLEVLIYEFVTKHNNNEQETESNVKKEY